MSDKFRDIPAWRWALFAFFMFILYLFADNIKTVRENTEFIKSQCVEKVGE